MSSIFAFTAILIFTLPIAIAFWITMFIVSMGMMALSKRAAKRVRRWATVRALPWAEGVLVRQAAASYARRCTKAQAAWRH
jgi:hypothetical protein